MLTQLPSLKSRLGILETDTTNDGLLTGAIQAVSRRFDQECRRTLARTVGVVFEFGVEDTEILPPCYPIETVQRFEIKTSERTGWVEEPNIEFIIRNGCVISLISALAVSPQAVALARVIYTGGFVLPGATALPGQTPLPPDIEQAATDQAAYWFQNRDRLGLQRIWEYHSTYRQFAVLDLLPGVRAVLESYGRWAA
jgi:hypothetical protein